MRSIFITGAASGIGRAVARLFARRGWSVGLADVNLAGLQETQALLGSAKSTLHLMDVREREQWVDSLDAFVGSNQNRIDVLFNNAGIAVSGPFAATPPAELERIVAINLMGVVHGAHAGYPYLKRTPDSCLLNTASAAAIYGVSGGAIYAATKFAVRGLTESLDAEWAADGIRVHSLMPGYIDTPLLDCVPVGSNDIVRERVRAAGLEFTPLDVVAQRAWDAVQGDRLHTRVGKTADRLAFAARWMPGSLRKRMRKAAGM